MKHTYERLLWVVRLPGYAFRSSPHGISVPNEDRLTITANMARERGMGLEIEVFGPTDPCYRAKVQLQLDHGDETLDGYRDAVHAYYGANFISHVGASSDPRFRQTYEDLYQFAKGTYQRRVFHQPLVAPTLSSVIPGQSTQCLVDGLWATRTPAMGKGYVLDPRAKATYPDPGRKKLTDGILSESVSDDKTVGWAMPWPEWYTSVWASFVMSWMLSRQRMIGHLISPSRND